MASHMKLEDIKDSEDSPMHFCTQCQLDGRLAPAVGYCMICVEYLCDVCYRRHCQPSRMRSHILLNQSQMPDKNIMKEKHKFDEICTEHTGIAIAYFCKKCDVIGCCKCMRVGHTNCTEVTYIPDHVKTEKLKGKKIYSDWWYTYDSPITNVQKVKDKIDRYKSGVELKANEARKQVKKFRENMLAALDELENEMENKISTISKEDLFLLDMLMKKCNLIQEKFTKVKNEIEKGKAGENESKLFVSSKIAVQKLKEFEENKVIENLKSDLKIRSINFVPNFKESVGKSVLLGDVVEVACRQVKKDWKVIGEINAKTKEEIEQSKTSKTYCSYCTISACIILDDGKLMVCDSSSNSVRLCETEIPDSKYISNVLSTVEVDAVPKGITQISDDFVAVTLPSIKQIQYIEFVEGDRIEKEASLDVNGECVGIGYLDENLIVTFINPGKVEIMDTDGHVLKVISSDKEMSFSFLKPLSVACDDSTEMIYISDFEADAVVALNPDGKVKTVFKDDGMDSPLGVALGKDGCILVAVKWPYSVQMIDKYCLEIEKLQVKDDTWGIEYIAFSDGADRLFYGTGSSIINVRKI